MGGRRGSGGTEEYLPREKVGYAAAVTTKRLALRFYQLKIGNANGPLEIDG